MNGANLRHRHCYAAWFSGMILVLLLLLVPSQALADVSVSSISVDLSYPMTRTEYANGLDREHYWYSDPSNPLPYDYDGISYYPYYVPLLSEGDQLTITWSDNSTSTYRFEDVVDSEDPDPEELEPHFRNVDDPTDVLPMSDFDGPNTTQSFFDQWRVGMHYCTLSYKGKSCTIPIEVEEAQHIFARLWGENGLSTMASIIECGHTRFAQGGTVVLATQSSYKDALTAAGLAGLDDGVVLLVSKGHVPNITMQMLERLSPSKVYIMGGTLAIAEQVEEEVMAQFPELEDIIRIAGDNAPLTSVKAYQQGEGWSKTCIVATNASFADALSVAPYAYRYHAPIFLASPNKLEDAVCDAIKNDGFEHVVIVGGTAAVSQEHEDKLREVCPDVHRIGGANAVETSMRIAEWCIEQGMTASHMGVATANSYKDALTGTALCGSQNSVMVLTRPNNYVAIDGVINYVNRNVYVGYIFGGPAAVPDDTFYHCEYELGWV